MSTIRVNKIEPLSNDTVEVSVKDSIKVVDTISDLLLESGTTDYLICVKGNINIGDAAGGLFYFDISKILINDGVLCFNGWVKILNRDSITPQLFGAKSTVGFNNSTAMTNAINFCSDNNLTLFVPDGIYDGSDISITKSCNIVLSPGATLNFQITISGEPYIRSNTVQLSGNWPVFPTNTTTFSGDFSLFSAGDLIVVELSSGDSGAAAQNQSGVDFLTVQSANSSQLITTAGTRMPFRNPRISKIIGSVISGTLSSGSYTISGNYTSKFSSGDILRLENLDGTDGVAGSKYYFEYSKIKSIDTSSITLEHRTQNSYNNATLVKTSCLNGVSLSGGGKIKVLNCSNIKTLKIANCEFERLNSSFIYDCVINSINVIGQSTPISFGLTFCFYGSITSCKASNAAGSTDNGAFKLLSCPGICITNLNGSDTTATAQGIYGAFIDYYYTPYAIWNTGLVINGLSGSMARGGSARAIWILGVRDGDLQAQSTYGGICLENTIDTTLNVNCKRGMLEIRNIKRCDVSGHSKILSIEGEVNSIFNVTTRDSGGSNSNRCVWVRAGTADPETGTTPFNNTAGILNVINTSTTSTDITIYLQSVSGLVIGPNCFDNTGLLASVSFGASVTSVILHPCSLQNAMSASSTIWQPVRTKLIKFDGNWQDGLVFINGHAFWVDASGKLRINASRPTADTNGTVVGTQS